MMEFDELLRELQIHVPTVMARFCDNKALLQRFICKFPAEKTFDELNSACQAQRFEDADRAVHTLKGIAANLGFDRLYQGCVDMLADLRGPREDLAAKFADICAEYERLTNCIDSYAVNMQKKG